MALLIHVLIAISSLFYTAYVFFRPTTTKLHGSYLLVALTVLSGTYLVLSMQATLLHACVSGLCYLGLVFGGIIATHRKLAVSTGQSTDSKLN